jgi:ParB family chromosome partitioning protein
MYKTAAPVKESVNSGLPQAYKIIEDNLASHFSIRVKIRHSKKLSHYRHRILFAGRV